MTAIPASSPRRPLRRRARRKGALGFDTLVRIVYLALFLLFLLAPLYWLFVTSIKPVTDYMVLPPVWWPEHPTFSHFVDALFKYRGLEGLINSAIIATSATILSALLGTLMGYSFARFNTGGQHLSFWVLSQRFLPPVAVVLPIFLLYRSYGLNDTRLGLVLIYTAMTLPLSGWMMFAYFRQMPSTLEEAALVDGYGRWGAFWKVALPLALPGVVAAAVFAFIFCWTEFFFALILTSRHAFTLPTVFRAFISFQAAQYGESSALAITSLLPSIILGLLVQKHLVRGLTLGAVRG